MAIDKFKGVIILRFYLSRENICFKWQMGPNTPPQDFNTTPDCNNTILEHHDHEAPPLHSPLWSLFVTSSQWTIISLDSLWVMEWWARQEQTFAAMRGEREVGTAVKHSWTLKTGSSETNRNRNTEWWGGQCEFLERMRCCVFTHFACEILKVCVLLSC